MKNIVIFFFIFLLLILLVWIAGGAQPPAYLQAKESQIKQTLQSAVPIGSGVPAVIAYLDQNKIEHGDYDRPHQQLVAIERKVDRSFFVITDVQITFWFDSNDKLIKLVLKEVYTGL